MHGLPPRLPASKVIFERQLLFISLLQMYFKAQAPYVYPYSYFETKNN